MFDLKTQLNQSQLEAVTTIDGPLLVIAGAGSGKTRVIEYRVLHLVQNNVSPDSILLLTFTRKASREMLSRAARHDPRCRNVNGGTFHSFGYRTLRKYAKVIGLPNSFSVLDEGDAGEAIHRCCTKLGFFEHNKRFPKKDTLKSIISTSINKNASISDVLKKEYPHFLQYTPAIKTLKTKYTEYKTRHNYLDYDDLLVYLKLLLENRSIRERISQQYQYIMVDEYQDTNGLQGDIVRLLGAQHRNVMIVGDDAQSIYGFRGASHENIMEFPKDFPGCKTIKLEENYRSTQSILDVANAVLANMKNKYSKCLTSVKEQTGKQPALNFFNTAYEEAASVAERIKELNNEGIALNQIGVLYRSSHLSIPLQAELAKRNMPYQVFGGLRFHELAHVKDMIAYLKILINPKDELAWHRILMLIEGIGPKTSERILKDIFACAGFGEILAQAFRKYQAGYKYSKELVRLKSVLKSAGDERLSVGEQFKITLDYYTPILKDKFDNWHRRLNDLEILEQIFMRYNSLAEVLVDLAIELPERGVKQRGFSEPDDEKSLTLSTIHSAKGLEWEVIFLIGLVDGHLPVSFALNDEGEIEEEHRLFYVAVTRAKNLLYLSLPNEGFGESLDQFNKISMFVDVPNVLSKLETKHAPYPKMEWTALHR